jgi:hypothetical protein
MQHAKKKYLLKHFISSPRFSKLIAVNLASYHQKTSVLRSRSTPFNLARRDKCRSLITITR